MIEPCRRGQKGEGILSRPHWLRGHYATEQGLTAELKESTQSRGGRESPGKRLHCSGAVIDRRRNKRQGTTCSNKSWPCKTTTTTERREGEEGSGGKGCYHPFNERGMAFFAENIRRGQQNQWARAWGRVPLRRYKTLSRIGRNKRRRESPVSMAGEWKE